MTDPQTDLLPRFVALARELAEQATPQQTAETLTRLAVELVGGAEDAGLSLSRRRGRIETVAPTSALVACADELQHELGEGPCVDAIRVDEVDVPDLDDDDRWPRWRPAVAQEGVGSMFCVELSLADRTVGALNLYASRAHAFSDSDRVAARHLAGLASVALSDAEQQATLREGLASRTVIGQAEGLLMERFGIDADQAFAALTRYSQHSNVRLADVAEKLVATRDLPQT